MMQKMTSTKGFIYKCYAILLVNVLDEYPLKAENYWAADIGPFEEDQWVEAMFQMGTLDNLLCGKCSRDHRNLIHLLLLWHCLKSILDRDYSQIKYSILSVHLELSQTMQLRDSR